MEKINNVLNKQYSFSGTHLLLGGLFVFALIVFFSCAGGRHGGKRMMMDHDMMRGDRGQMMQQYDRQGMKGKQKQGIIRGQSNGGTNNQGQPEPMMMDGVPQEQAQPAIPTSGTTAQ